MGQDLRAAYAAATASARPLCPRSAPPARPPGLPHRVRQLRPRGLLGAELLDARRNLLDAESQYTDALAAANDTRAELERAAATPLDSLETGGTNDR